MKSKKNFIYSSCIRKRLNINTKRQPNRKIGKRFVLVKTMLIASLTINLQISLV